MKTIDLQVEKHAYEICVWRCGFGLTGQLKNILHKRRNPNFNLKERT
jgi:hypothetical protein